MPLVKFDMIKGRTPSEISKLLDVSHQIFTEALALPPGDRFQIVTQHEKYELVMEDINLGFKRTSNRLIITVVSRERLTHQKETLYKRLAETLERECQIDPQDLMVSMITNQSEDWSFGVGEAQFLNGAL